MEDMTVLGNETASSCVASVKPVALALAGLSVAAIATLNAESEIVIAIADMLSVGAEDVVKILPAIEAVVGEGADAIAETICAAMGRS